VERAVFRIEVGHGDPATRHERLVRNPQERGGVPDVVEHQLGDHEVEAPLGRPRIVEKIEVRDADVRQAALEDLLSRDLAHA
jgi:hypothetical protein